MLSVLQMLISFSFYNSEQSSLQWVNDVRGREMTLLGRASTHRALPRCPSGSAAMLTP